MCKTYNVDIPFYLMNSFYTDNDTKTYLNEKGYEKVRTFEQSKCPRLDAETKLPVAAVTQNWGDDAWYPPGHGNIFESLKNSGVLDELLSDGRELIFVSNIDNTGADVSFQITQLMLDENVDFVMECTQKTETDVKGGTLIDINDQMMHLEMPQVPPENLSDFCSTKVFKIFNTNNIWVNLNAINNRLPNIRSEIIVNKKNVRGREVLQLEFSIGGCIKNFHKALCVHVNRDRFRPVKNLGDLLSLRSTLCDLNTTNYKIHHNHAMGVPPIISLDPSVYTSVEEINKRFPHPLVIKKCTQFNVIGNVRFGKNVQLSGKVTVTGKTENESYVCDNSVLVDEEYIAQ
uniref:UTP--glucose-1-phosphate uridylyltransferase n=1 Tax=Caenorhabditis tropicalis TaxID=1561998 RepID=A0A1I7T5L9_9PELO